MMDTKRQWKRVLIKGVCESIIDCVNKTAPTVEGPTPYKMIRTTNVKAGSIDLIDVKYVTKEIYDKWTRRAVPKKGDVILTREAPLGEVGMLRNNDTIFLGQRLIQYRVDPEKLDNHFLLYSFQADDLQLQIKSFGSGATVKHMRVPDAEKLTILLPDLPLQQKIASILSKVDEQIEQTEQIIEKMELLKKGLMQKLLTKGIGHTKFKKTELGEIPEEWKMVRVGEVAKINMGQSPSSSTYNDYGEGLPFFQGNADFGSLFPQIRLYTSNPIKTAYPNEILMSVRAPVGALNYCNVECCIGRGLCSIKMIKGNNNFLFYLLKFKNEDLNSKSSGSTFSSINKQALNDFKIAIPSLPEQQKIASILSKVDSQIQDNQNYLTKLQELKKGLMQDLLTGKVRVCV